MLFRKRIKPRSDCNRFAALAFPGTVDLEDKLQSQLSNARISGAPRITKVSSWYQADSRITGSNSSIATDTRRNRDVVRLILERSEVDVIEDIEEFSYELKLHLLIEVYGLLEA